ncbi:MAG: DUF982 domain-containing protein [Rhizobiaceae bacterium]
MTGHGSLSDQTVGLAIALAVVRKEPGYRRFHKPVVVQTGRIDRERVVFDAGGAAEVLRLDWRNTACPKRLAALRACLRVIRKEKPPSYARRAFIAAAKEARVLIDT